MKKFFTVFLLFLTIVACKPIENPMQIEQTDSTFLLSIEDLKVYLPYTQGQDVWFVPLDWYKSKDKMRFTVDKAVFQSDTYYRHGYVHMFCDTVIIKGRCDVHMEFVLEMESRDGQTLNARCTQEYTTIRGNTDPCHSNHEWGAQLVVTSEDCLPDSLTLAQDFFDFDKVYLGKNRGLLGFACSAQLLQLEE